MKLKLPILIVLSLCFAFADPAFAQIKSISGTVIDEPGNIPLAGVTVAMISKSTQKIITGTSTNESGKFEIKYHIKDSGIILRFSFIGYETKEIDSLAAKNNKADLGIIKLHPSAIMTSAVEIKGQRPMVEFYIDKQVINMEKVPGSTSGSVTDALKNTGIVEVEPSTNKLSVRGNSNVNILIDGKPQPMADNLLAQMPATYVDKVEVVTTPSAKDDPEGDGGTINIITKKNKMENYNGSVSLNSSTQGIGFGTLGFNFKKNKFNVFSSGNFYLGQFGRTTRGQRINYSSQSLHSQNSEGDSKTKGYMTSFKLGIDYDLDSLNSFSITGNYNKTNGKMIISSGNWLYNDNSLPTYSYTTKDDGNGDFNNYSVTANYKKKINSKGTEISTDAFYSNMINSTSDLMTTDYNYMSQFPRLQKNANEVKNSTVIFNSDYVNPTEKYGKFEAGYKFTLRNRTTALDNLNFSYLSNNYSDSLGLSNIFKYDENIHALYFAYTNKISIIEYKLGLRMEQTFAESRQLVTEENYKTDYLSWFPTLGLSYKLNDLFQLAFNASRKINRPQMDMINPFVKVNGPNNITRGNPRLGPTYVNAFEMRFNPLINVYYTNAKGRPTSISTNIDDSVTVNTTINSAATKNYGIELTIPIINEPRFPISLPEWFNMFNLRISYNRFMEDGRYLSEIYSIKRDNWRLNGNLGLKLWADISTMLYFSYSPKTEDTRYRNSEMVFFGLLLSRDFMNKKLQISLNINDLFNSMHPENETFGSNFYSYNRTEFIKNRSIGISIRYNFNDFISRQEKNVDDGRDKSDSGLF